MKQNKLIDERRSNFTIIDNSMFDTELSIYAKMVYFVLCRYSFGKENCFPALETIAKKAGCSKSSVCEALRELEKNKFIRRQKRKKGKQCLSTIYTLLNIPTLSAATPCIERVTDGGCPPHGQGVVRHTDSKNINLNNKKQKIVSDCIDYLNKKTEKQFNQNITATIRNIIHLQKQGYNLEDFKKVIDVKYAQWKGTKFEEHLNPKTLFKEENFESYINQKPQKQEQEDPADKWVGTYNLNMEKAVGSCE